MAEGTFDVLSTDIDTLDVVDRTAVREATAGVPAGHRAPRRGLHRRRRLRVRSGHRLRGQRPRAPATSPRRRPVVGAHLVYISTDYVFDGTLDRPYVEWDPPNPRSVYGRSKLGGELEVHDVAGPSATIVRTAWVSGAHGANMVKTVLRLAAADPDGTLRFVDDQHGCPTFTADLARAVVRLALDRRPGTFHVTNQGETTWFGFARATLAAAGLDPDRVEPIATSDLDPPRPAPRPANSRLDNAALRLSGLPLLPGWTESLARLVGFLLAGRLSRCGPGRRRVEANGLQDGREWAEMGRAGRTGNGTTEMTGSGTGDVMESRGGSGAREPARPPGAVRRGLGSGRCPPSVTGEPRCGCCPTVGAAPWRSSASATWGCRPRPRWPTSATG